MPLSVSHSSNSGAWQTQLASRLLHTHQPPPLALDSRGPGPSSPSNLPTSHLSFLLYLPWERAGRLRPPAMSSDTSPLTAGKLQRTNPLPGLGQLRTHIMIQVLAFYTRKHQDSDAEDLFLKKKNKAKYSPKQVQFSRSVVSDTLQPHESQHVRPPCPSPTPGVYPSSCPLSRWCPPTISSSAVPFSSCPQSIPESGSLPMSQLFAWGGQSIGVSASASVLPMNTRYWSPLGWTGLISS